MGIRGLITAISKVYTAENGYNMYTRESIQKASTFLVDGFGFMYWIISKESLHDRLWGGNYLELDQLFRREIMKLKDMHVNIFIYIDGKLREGETQSSADVKVKTIKARAAARDDKWSALFNYCVGSRDATKARSPDCYPKPPLAWEQFLACVDKLGIETVQCEGEADQDLAIACCTLIDRGEKAYILGNDSDFLVMKGSAVIMFDGFESDYILKETVAKVYRREIMAKELELSEAQMVEWAILLGNDYSREEMDVGFDNLPSPLPSDIDRLRLLVKERGSDFQCSSSVSNLQGAINYSRSYYNLEDASCWALDAAVPTSPPVSDEADDSVEVLVAAETGVNNVMDLTSEQKQVVARYLDDQGGTFTQHISRMGIGRALLNVIEGIVSTSDVFASQLTQVHISKLHEMYATLPVNPGKVKKGKSSEKPQLAWSNVIASVYYQKLCRFILSAVEMEFVFEPLAYFHGLTFQTLMMRGGEGKSQTSHDAMETIEAKISVLPDREGEVVVNKQRLLDFARPKEAVDPSFGKEVLPIDLHREKIVAHIKNNRVTIVHGETGCGKSSRLPLMLLEESHRAGKKCSIYISQPRRIAVMGLLKRLRPTLGDTVGMKMGHGIRDCTKDTELFLVTTGYLVRMLANNPDLLGVDTLILDEVHERSVDGDLLCYFAKRALEVNRNIRIVLMSATIHTNLYREYFLSSPIFSREVSDIEVISVGVRRFPVDLKFAEDLQNVKSANHPLLAKWAKELCEAKSLTDKAIKARQYKLTEAIIRTIVPKGSGVLVFVSGMSDILEVAELFSHDAEYRVFPVHSDIPLDEQLDIFSPIEETKIVVATNAAESSITLPDVDYVICLGTHKSMGYDPSGHFVKLENRLICKASATQRIGRTGRTREGFAFRLYSKSLYESMAEHDDAEIQRMTLEDVILRVRSIVEESSIFGGRVIPLLSALIEPPDTVNVLQSFKELHRMNMIDKPADEGNLTSLGKFASQLPVDIALSRLIVYGIVLGVPLEAIVVAAALSLPTPTFRQGNPLYQTDPHELHAIVKTSFLGYDKLDGGVYSQPLMFVRALVMWNKLEKSQKRYDWTARHGIVHKRFEQFVSVTTNLVCSVSRLLPQNMRDKLSVGNLKMPTGHTLNTLRLILTFAGEKNVLELCNGIDDTSIYTKNVIITNGNIFTSSEISNILRVDQVGEFTVTSNQGVDILGTLKSDIVTVDGMIMAVLALIAATDRKTEVPLYVIQSQSQGDGSEENSKAIFTTLTIVTCNSQIEDHPRFQWITTHVSETISRREVKTLEGYIYAYTLSKATRVQLRDVKKAIEELATSVHLFRPYTGQSELRMNRMGDAVSESLLVKLLFLEVKEIRRRGSHQMITFEDKEAEGRIVGSGVPSHPLISDLALGVRLLESLKETSRKKIIEVSRPTTGDGCELVPIKASNPYPLWRVNRFLSSDTLPMFKTLYPPRSSPSTSMHCSKGQLFCVAHSILVVGNTSKDLNGRVEGTTFLPPGGRWLSLALLCHGLTLADIQRDNCFKYTSSEDTEGQGVFNSPPTENDCDFCMQFFDQMCDAVTFKDIAVNWEMIGLVKLIFREWLSATEAEDDLTEAATEGTDADYITSEAAEAPKEKIATPLKSMMIPAAVMTISGKSRKSKASVVGPDDRSEPVVHASITTGCDATHSDEIEGEEILLVGTGPLIVDPVVTNSVTKGMKGNISDGLKVPVDSKGGKASSLSTEKELLMAGASNGTTCISTPIYTTVCTDAGYVSTVHFPASNIPPMTGGVATTEKLAERAALKRLRSRHKGPLPDRDPSLSTHVSTYSYKQLQSAKMKLSSYASRVGVGAAKFTTHHSGTGFLAMVTFPKATMPISVVEGPLADSKVGAERSAAIVALEVLKKHCSGKVEVDADVEATETALPLLPKGDIKSEVVSVSLSESVAANIVVPPSGAAPVSLSSPLGSASTKLLKNLTVNDLDRKGVFEHTRHMNVSDASSSVSYRSLVVGLGDTFTQFLSQNHWELSRMGDRILTRCFIDFAENRLASFILRDIEEMGVCPVTVYEDAANISDKAATYRYLVNDLGRSVYSDELRGILSEMGCTSIDHLEK